MTAGFPPNISGPFTVRCRVTAKPGKADRVEALMAKIKASAESEKEPDCLTWQPTRGIDGDSNKFQTFEKYSNPQAFFFHSSQPALQEFVNADLVDVDSMEFFDEIGARIA